MLLEKQLFFNIQLQGYNLSIISTIQKLERNYGNS